ncbi:hypothetical protein LDENG_00182270 [Lucifuga dentata]|nr:hypothetical protein LDENG_00182270 [Lucifuga dentata]
MKISANEFNNVFVNVGPNLAKEIPEITVDDYTGNSYVNNINTMFLVGVEEAEVLNSVKNYKGKRSMDCDEFDMLLLKNIIECVFEPFTYICNLSFTSGVFPVHMKTAKVVPLYKTGDRHLFSNYRPVSLLPQFSKILEKLFVTRLDKFIEKHNILNDNQYGFRAKHSTAMALMELVEEISTAVDKKEYMIGIFVDLKKAFDTIDHELLLKKLGRYGIRGVAHSWLSSYLKNRYQYVKIDDTVSELLQVNCGVPQGSVLGPRLFILYMNDLSMTLDLFKYILFADDTNLFYSGKHLDSMLHTVDREMDKVKNWFDINKLSLNLEKTKFMIFSNRTVNINAQIKIGNIEIERVKETKFLGVIIYDKLRWKSHITHVGSKVSKSIAILYKAKNLLNDNALHILYYSIIAPYINYCVAIWGNAKKKPSYRSNC